MVEKSYFWDYASPPVGDADLSPYTDDVFSDLFAMLFTEDRDTQGVLFGYLGSLEVDSALNEVSVAKGGAIVDGKLYLNNAAYYTSISTPSASTRIDVVVLRKDFAAHTVRIAVITGVEGAGAPALTQVDGDVWEIPLANITITVSGTSYVTDRRMYAAGNVGFNNLLAGGRLSPRLNRSENWPFATGGTINTSLDTVFNVIQWSTGQAVMPTVTELGMTAWQIYYASEAAGGANRLHNTVHDAILNINPVEFTGSAMTGYFYSPYIYYNAHVGPFLSLYISGIGWVVHVVNNTVGLDISSHSDKICDIFAYGANGQIMLEAEEWASSTARATNIERVDGVYVQSGDVTRRYLGTIYVTTDGYVRDDSGMRGVWNYYNRLEKELLYTDTTASWNYTTAAWRNLNNVANAGFDLVVGVKEDAFRFQALVTGGGSTLGRVIGIGTAASTLHASCINNDSTASTKTGHNAILYIPPNIGLTHIYPLEYGNTSGVFYGSDGIALSGIVGLGKF